jgi:predicted TIM-barrel fold metal-dependent hydrolase
MEKQDDVFVLDAVAHAFNLDPSNFAIERVARASFEMFTRLCTNTGTPAYDYPRELIQRDWPVSELANLLFHESQTHVAVYHPTPIFIYKDGLSSVPKAAESVKKYPHRFIGAYACVDPLSKGWEKYLEDQVTEFDPMGLKLYPASWHDQGVTTWAMNDPKVAFPVYEKAAELGLKHVAVHKALPSGPMEYQNALNPKDVEGAAAHFPDLTFEIVHGGLAFLEETAWLLGQFSNIYITMENTNITAARRPRRFAKILLGLMHVAGNKVYDRLIWATGTVQYHPRPCVEAMLDFEFPEDLLEHAGLFSGVDQITMEHKRNILAGNFVRSHDLNLEKLKAGIEGDQFWRAAGEPLPEPLSTLEFMKARA